MCSENSEEKDFSKPLMTYTPPVLHTGKTWYVDFCSYDPATGTMRRKKYNVRKIKGVRARRAYAQELMASLIFRLRAGWSPWVIVDKIRNHTTLNQALELYKNFNSRKLTPKSLKTVNSFLKLFEEYVSSQLIPIRFVYQLTTPYIIDYLDHLYIDRELSPRTVNNYRGWLHGLCAFFVERRMLDENPVERTKPMPEQQKKRQPLTPQMLSQLNSYLRKEDPHFLLACRIEYYCFIRPNELMQIKLNDISIKEQSVLVRGVISKNKRDGKVALNAEIIKLMIDLGIFNYPGTSYLFGKRNFLPSESIGEPQMFRRRWDTVRKALGWSKDYHFYSLKDSGIRDLANAEGIVVARDQARHTDVATTNRYLQGRDLPVHESAKRFKGNL